MVYPTDEETFDGRVTPEFIRQGHLNSIQGLLKRIQDFLGYGGRIHDSKGLVTPVGAILPFGGIVEPDGFLFCDGKSYSRTHGDTAALFAVIGTSYGASGAFSFNVPDARGLFLRGYSKVLSKSFVPGDVDTGIDQISLPDNDFNRTGFPVRFTTSGTLPAPFIINKTYYITEYGTGLNGFATTRANALAFNLINITTTGAGTSTVVPYVEEEKDSRLKSTFGGNSGEDIGTYQGDTMLRHTHVLRGYQSGGSGGTWPHVYSTWGGGPLETDNAVRGAPASGIEVRPRNINVNYIIKR